MKENFIKMPYFKPEYAILNSPTAKVMTTQNSCTRKNPLGKHSALLARVRHVDSGVNKGAHWLRREIPSRPHENEACYDVTTNQNTSGIFVAKPSYSERSSPGRSGRYNKKRQKNL